MTKINNCQIIFLQNPIETKGPILRTTLDNYISTPLSKKLTFIDKKKFDTKKENQEFLFFKKIIKKRQTYLEESCKAWIRTRVGDGEP